MNIKNTKQICNIARRTCAVSDGFKQLMDEKWVAVEDLLKWLEDNFCLHGTGGDIYNKIKEEVALDEENI